LSHAPAHFSLFFKSPTLPVHVYPASGHLG
jgi:hypothetical protein